MKLLTDAIKKALPPLYSTEDIPTDQKEVVVKFFNPMGVGTWEVYEGSKNVEGDWLFFGRVDLGYDGAEWGYFSLSELQRIKLPMGLGIERDICVNPHLHDEWAAMDA